VVLSGSCCFAALGVMAAMDESAPGVVWFDAHGDFNTPETTNLGYFDGMGLAVLTGSAWQGMLRTVPGAKPLPESAIVLAGARDFDDDEARRLRDSEMKHLPAEEIASGDELDGAMAALEPEPTGLYLHVDLDVLDPEQEAPANVYSAPGGITAEQLAARVEQVLRTGSVRAFALTAYDPECDAEGARAAHCQPAAQSGGEGRCARRWVTSPEHVSGGPSPHPGPHCYGDSPGS
jgi:arginase